MYFPLDHGVTAADASLAATAAVVSGGLLLASAVSYWLWRRRDLRRAT